MLPYVRFRFDCPSTVFYFNSTSPPSNCNADATSYRNHPPSTAPPSPPTHNAKTTPTAAPTTTPTFMTPVSLTPIAPPLLVLVLVIALVGANVGVIPFFAKMLVSAAKILE
jgi:hypothetical protein